MKKKRQIRRVGAVICTVLAVIGLVFSGCAGPSISEEEAQEIAGKGLTAFSAAVVEATSSPHGIKSGVEPLAKDTFNYSSGALTVTGTYDPGTGDYNLELTFSSYTYRDVTLSGSASYDVSDFGASGTYTGDFEITYGGTTYNMTWNFTVSGSNITGEFSIDGWAYTY